MAKKIAKTAAGKVPAVTAATAAVAPLTFDAPTDDGATLSRMVDTTIAAAHKMMPMLHMTAVSCVLHVIKHGDPIHMVRFFNGIGKAVRREALAKYFIAFAGVKFVKADSKTGKDNSFVVDTKTRDAVVERYSADPEGYRDNLIAKKFWEVEPEKLFNKFDLLAQIEALVEKAELYKKGKKRDGSDLTEEELEKINLVGLVTIKNALKSARKGAGDISALH